MPVAELYRWCEIARGILQGPHAVGRVIARPFAGVSGAYERTPRRRDFSLEPPGPTYLDLLHERGVPVIGVGKIGEIFVQRGVDVDDHTTDNTAGIAACTRHLRRWSDGLLFANLVDFDQVWGHRNDVAGFAAGLAAVDAAVGEWLPLLARRRRHAALRRPRRGPDDGEHRPLARVLAAARARAWRRGATTAPRRTSAPRRSRCSPARRRRCRAGRSADAVRRGRARPRGRLRAARGRRLRFGARRPAAGGRGERRARLRRAGLAAHASCPAMATSCSSSSSAAEGPPGSAWLWPAAARTATKAGRARSWSAPCASWPRPASRGSC